MGMTIGLEFAFQAYVSIDEDLTIGPVPGGIRNITPITGGVFEGPGIKGTVIPGGADWSLTRENGVIDICARYTLKTDDDVLIYVINKGLYIEKPGGLQERPASREGVEPVPEYFRTTPVFEVSNEKYDWLNRNIFVCDPLCDHAGKRIGTNLGIFMPEIKNRCNGRVHFFYHGARRPCHFTNHVKNENNGRKQARCGRRGS